MPAANARPQEVEKRENIAYRSQSELPAEDTKTLKIFIDKKHEAVVLPIYGIAVPFHISTIKNLSQSQEGETTYLRINFFTPGGGFGRQDTVPAAVRPTQIGKRTQPPTGGCNDLRQGADVQEHLSGGPQQCVPADQGAAEALQAARGGAQGAPGRQRRLSFVSDSQCAVQDLVEQDELKLNTRGTAVRINDLAMRPSLATRRVSGSLEAHRNGFRYTSQKGDKVDILFSNIKHAFFQPCEHEVVILFHFHLKVVARAVCCRG